MRGFNQIQTIPEVIQDKKNLIFNLKIVKFKSKLRLESAKGEKFCTLSHDIFHISNDPSKMVSPKSKVTQVAHGGSLDKDLHFVVNSKW